MQAPRFLAFRELSALARLFEFRSVSRWVGLGLVMGVLSGLAAGALFVAVEGISHLVLHLLAHYDPLTPRGEVKLFDADTTGPARRWVLVLAPAFGALLASMLVSRFGPRVPEQGNDLVIRAFHTGRGLEGASPFVKGYSASIVIGTGGSAGREGPIAVIGAACGMAVARLLGLSDHEKRTLLLAGAAGGIGAIFQSPLGAALFMLEILYRDDFEVEAMVPTVLSSVVAYSIYTMIFGRGTIFFTAKSYDFNPLQLPFYLFMAGGAALVGLLFIQIFQQTRTRLFDRLPLPRFLHPFVGGLAVGLMSLVVPQALGPGYGWLQEALLPSSNLLPAGWSGAFALLGIALAKVVTTTLSIGSGAPGGIFGPSVVIGGLLGGAFGVAFHQIVPTIVTEPAAFAVVGMACFVGGIMKAPISTLVMASEMTGSYDLLVPLMFAEVVTYALSRNFTIYPAQVSTRRQSGAHAAEYVFDVLDEVHVESVFDAAAVVVPVSPSTPVVQLLKHASETEHAVFPVVGADGAIRGIVTLETLRAAFVDADLQRLAIAEDCAAPFVSLAPRETLRVALERFAASHLPVLPVVNPENPRSILGLLSYEDLLTAYADELMRRRDRG